jgi:hypothetical protein
MGLLDSVLGVMEGGEKSGVRVQDEKEDIGGGRDRGGARGGERHIGEI